MLTFLYIVGSLKLFTSAFLVCLIPLLSACTVATMDVHGLKQLQGGQSISGLKTTEVFSANQTQQKVDILFVDDNSASMEPMQTSLGDRFSSFATAVQGLDWQIGITTTDCSTGPYGICGSLIPMAGTGNRVLTPSVPSFSTVFRNTIVRPETVGCLIRGDCPSGDSTPLKATVNALSKFNAANAGFFRSDAALAVVILTNANENNIAPTPASTTPQMVIDELTGIWANSKKIRAYAIAILNGDNGCLNQQQMSGLAAFGTYPINLASMTGGISVSICANNYSPILSQIGNDLKNDVPTFFKLAHNPVPSSLKVTLAPDPGISWTLTGDTLYFSAPLPQSTVVTVEYEY